MELLAVIWLPVSRTVMLRPEYAVPLTGVVTLPVEHVSVFPLCEHVAKPETKLLGVKL